MSCVLTGHRSKFLNYGKFMSLKIVFILANSADADEMPIPFSSGTSMFAKVPGTCTRIKKGYFEELYVDSNIFLGIFISSIKFL